MQAAKILNCSYIEVRDHPERHKVMNEAFTLFMADKEADEIKAEDAKSKAELEAKSKAKLNEK